MASSPPPFSQDLAHVAAAIQASKYARNEIRVARANLSPIQQKIATMLQGAEKGNFTEEQKAHERDWYSLEKAIRYLDAAEKNLSDMEGQITCTPWRFEVAASNLGSYSRFSRFLKHLKLTDMRTKQYCDKCIDRKFRLINGYRRCKSRSW